MNTEPIKPEPTNATPPPSAAAHPTPSRTVLLAALALLLVQALVTLLVFPVLPATVASHWNAQGQIDSFEPKAVYVLIMPAISVVLFAFLVVIWVATLNATRTPRATSGLLPGQQNAPTVAAQQRLILHIFAVLLIGQQTFFLLTQIGLLVLALTHTGHPTL